jgi:hypothetical protein
MWGQAMYFAKNASYSDSANGGYKFVDPDTKENVLILAEVILGEYPMLAPDNTLRRPPLKANG